MAIGDSGIGDNKNMMGDAFSFIPSDSELEAGAAGWNAYNLNLQVELAKTGLVAKQMMEAMIPNKDVFQFMDEESTKIQHSFGLSKERVDEFKNSIANVAPELVKMGLTEGEVSQNIIDAMEGLGTAASLGKEAIVELAAAYQVTGVDVKILASNFRDVGISVYDVGENMKTVTEIARSAGVSVKAVSYEVTSNLGKMNLYNFDNGVKGLSKMAVTGERLGITMEKTFELAENLMSPEKAIDMSAALQRLGVTSSGLLDPLRAMDMAQNDPEALQKEMVELSKTFTKFNEETGQMEILPGSKRRLREVAEAFGYAGAKGAEEFASLGIKASDFDMKLKQIKMPDFAGDDETKELIASMAQMKGGVAQIEVRNKETGITTTKKVEELTSEDIENLKKATEDSSKSIEQIALEQLDTTKQTNSLLSSGIVATKFAVATTPTLSKFYGLVAESKLDIAKATNNIFGSTEKMRQVGESFAKPAEQMLVGLATGNEQQYGSAKDELTKKMSSFFENFGSSVGTQISSTQQTIVDRIKDAYSKPIQVEAKSDAKLQFDLNINSNVAGINFTEEQKVQIRKAIADDPEFIPKLLKQLNVPSATTGGKNQ